MCRLLGVVSAAPIAVSDAVGAHVLKDFVALTKIHGDGWGIANVGTAGQEPQVEVSAGSALDDPAFVAATQRPSLRREPGPSAVGHHRNRGAAAELPPVPCRPGGHGAQRFHQADGSRSTSFSIRRSSAVTARHHRQRALLRADPPTPPRPRRTSPRRSGGRWPSCVSATRTPASTRWCSARTS